MVFPRIQFRGIFVKFHAQNGKTLKFVRNKRADEMKKFDVRTTFAQRSLGAGGVAKQEEEDVMTTLLLLQVSLT